MIWVSLLLQANINQKKIDEEDMTVQSDPWKNQVAEQQNTTSWLKIY